MYILIAILVFGLLIFIHEGGHFLAARICKVTVNEFSIGMGPKLFSKRSKKSNTLYSLRALPIGGYVAMDGEDESSENPDAFCNKSVPKRMFIVLAGAFMNLLLGFILMFMLVFSQEFLLSTRIGAFNENSLSAEKLMIGDEVRRVVGARVHTGDELIYEIMNEGDKPIDLVVIRDGEEVLLEDVVFPNFVDSGVTFGEIDFKVYSEEATFGNYIKHAFYRSCSTVKMIYDSIFNLISGKYGMEAVSGPVGVTEVVGDAAKSGFSNLVYVVCVVSINLGVFNLLPIPALDGGKFAFLAVEAIIRRPINKKFEAYINFIGIVLLFGLMIFVTFKDIIKLILR